MQSLPNWLGAGLLLGCLGLSGCGTAPATVELEDAQPDPIAISPEELDAQTEDGAFTEEE